MLSLAPADLVESPALASHPLRLVSETKTAPHLPPTLTTIKYYKAPWSISLILLSAFGFVIFGVVAVTLLSSGGGPTAWMAFLPLAFLCGCGLFTIRGYTVAPDALLVHRLFWATQLPLSGLQSAEYKPGVMGWCLRTLGNGGLFSFSGFFRSRALGAYRAFVTDPQQTVVLHFRTRTVVVSPATPEDFVRDLAMEAPANADRLYCHID